MNYSQAWRPAPIYSSTSSTNKNIYWKRLGCKIGRVVSGTFMRHTSKAGPGPAERELGDSVIDSPGLGTDPVNCLKRFFPSVFFAAALISSTVIMGFLQNGQTSLPYKKVDQQRVRKQYLNSNHN